MVTRRLLPLALAVALLSCSGAGAHRAEDRTVAYREGAAAAERQEACSFVDTYRFGWSGGLALYHDVFTLQPPDRFSMVREYAMHGDSARRCEGTLPACASPDAITVRAMSALLTDSVVRAAWPDSGSRVFGEDFRPADAPLMAVTRETGGTLFLGDDCRQGGTCTPVPSEIRALRDTLARLSAQISSSDACADLGR